MNKVKIAVSDLVCYRSNTGSQILGRVRKVNRVNSKVQIWAINGRIVWRPDPVTVYKAYLRRAGPDMIDLANTYEF
jgi:hypothetical protein